MKNGVRFPKARKKKVVPVMAYPRFRFGRWEHVVSHYRSLPN